MSKYTQAYSVLYRTEEKKRCYLCDRGTDLQIGRHLTEKGSDRLKYLMPMCSWCIKSWSIEYQSEPFKPEETPKMNPTYGTPDNMDFDFT
jgi:hypothetical protein